MSNTNNLVCVVCGGEKAKNFIFFEFWNFGYFYVWKFIDMNSFIL